MRSDALARLRCRTPDPIFQVPELRGHASRLLTQVRNPDSELSGCDG
jgi:hypothetical protein